MQIVISIPEIMTLAVTEKKKIVVLHSIKNLGGTLTHPPNKVLALLGTSHDTKAVELIVKSALKDYKTKAPKFEDIKNKVTKDEINGVAVLA